MTGQIRDGLEPCPRDELVERLRIIRGNQFTPNENDLVATAITRIEANQSSLDTMGGRIEELEEELEHFIDIIDATDETGFDPHVEQLLMDATESARKALRGPVSRSHASHQAPVGLGRSGFDRGQSK
jgi:hypothetical protein